MLALAASFVVRLIISVLNSLGCVVFALVVFGVMGRALAGQIVPRPAALFLSPAIGWAAHSALALPLFMAIGFTRWTVGAAFVVPLAIAAVMIWQQGTQRTGDGFRLSPLWTIIVLAGVALIGFNMMSVDIPKVSDGGIDLAAPIFDHSKIAMIDEMTRLGVPPGNPFYGGEGPPRLAYYYLWHFSAAELSILTGITGWEADAGMSAFTGIACVAAMIGLAVWLGGNSRAALWVVVLAATASARPVLDALFGWEAVQAVTGAPSGLGGFLFQTSWAPQHAMAALVAVIALVSLVALVERPRMSWALVLGLLMAAAFESSTWIGGIAFPLMAAPVALTLWFNAPRGDRLRIAVHVAGAALVALVIIAPLLIDQSQTAALRNEGSPVAISPIGILDEDVFGFAGPLTHLLAYWLLYLPVELPAILAAGVAGLVCFCRDRGQPSLRRSIWIAFAIAAAISLACGSLLESTLGENNDLGWRAVLPGVLILMVSAAAFLARLTPKRQPIVLAAATALIVIGLVDGLRFGYGNVTGDAHESRKAMAQSADVWAAVRRHTQVAERVANNPGYLQTATPWPVNISWALMADRRSCFAGRELVRPFSALSAVRVDELESQFRRIFAGDALPGDIDEMAKRYNCDTAVVVPSDGAWARDPFATSAHYRLAEGTPGWRVYRRTGS